MTTPYQSATEHTRDELSLVGLFIARTIARGRKEGWVSDGAVAMLVPDEALFDKFRSIEQRLLLTEAPIPMDQLRRRFDLTLTEQRVLWTLLGYELDPSLRRLLHHLSTEAISGVTIGTMLSVVYDDAPGLGYVELAPGGRLSAFRLIDLEEGDKPVSHRLLRVTARLLELTAGIVRLDRDLERFAKLETPSQVQGLVMDPDVQISVNALIGARSGADSAVVMLAGPEGSGRRSLLRAAATQAELRLLSINSTQLPTSSALLELAFRAIFREAMLFDAGVVFDNLDASSGNFWNARTDQPSVIRNSAS